MSIEAYLSSLAPPRRELFTSLTAEASRLAASRVGIQNFVFVPGHEHPTWDDSADVVWRAVEQLMLVAPAADDELPIIWVGYDSASRLSRKREAQGLLLTDRRLIVKDSVDLVFSKGQARHVPLYARPEGLPASAAAIASAAFEGYDWGSAGSLVSEDDVAEFRLLLSAAIVMSLETMVRAGDERGEAPATSADIRGRVNELGLGSAVKYTDDAKHTKHFAKLAKKMPLDDGEQILASFSDSTLAGPYGLLLTDRNLRSRDLMEDPRSTPRSLVDTEAVRVSPENKHRIDVAEGEVHDIPSHLDARETAALITLITEWAGNRVN